MTSRRPLSALLALAVLVAAGFWVATFALPTDKVLFDSGSAVIKPQADPLLTEIAGLVDVDPSHPISVEGNTDNVPIVNAAKGRFATNWELSTARATEVVRYLQDEGGIDPHILSATGFGEYQPVAPNDTDEGRHKNRRIEIVLLPPLVK